MIGFDQETATKKQIAMRNIRKKIETAMLSRKGKTRFSPFESLLLMLSMGYGGAAKLRETLFKRGILPSKRLSCMVISIGNITVGGTGKTPMTIYVAELVKRFGSRLQQHSPLVFSLYARKKVLHDANY